MKKIQLLFQSGTDELEIIDDSYQIHIDDINGVEIVGEKKLDAIAEYPIRTLYATNQTRNRAYINSFLYIAIIRLISAGADKLATDIAKPFSKV